MERTIKILNEEGCENLVILPLYPQYAAATTATVCDEVYRTLMNMRWQPSLQIIPHYESEPLYIDALIVSIEKKIKEILSCVYCELENTELKSFANAFCMVNLDEQNNCTNETVNSLQTKLEQNFVKNDSKTEELLSWTTG